MDGWTEGRMMLIIPYKMWNLYFDKFQGQVAFNSEGDRITWTQIEQMWSKLIVKETKILQSVI